MLTGKVWVVSVWSDDWANEYDGIFAVYADSRLLACETAKQAALGVPNQHAEDWAMRMLPLWVFETEMLGESGTLLDPLERDVLGA